LIDELFRVTKKGRIVAIDCMNIPAMKSRDGYIGLKDFRGDIIRQFIDAGFIFHSEHCAWKDPLLEATRTKAIGLMHKQLCKDSSKVRAGIPQYILAFRKPGENTEPIAHEKGLEWFFGENPPKNGVLSHERWRRYASPVWMDIDFTRTLNGREARENQDERHICPMALDLIERCVHLWSNPKDTVYDPFAGICSTGYVAIRNGRRFVGSELKTSYWEQSCKNLERATSINYGLFSSEESDDDHSDEIEE
jgi:DNA modification methylase